MKCQVCKDREATIHFTNMIGSEVDKIHLCQQCAEEKGYDYLKKSNFGMTELLSGLLSSATETVRTKRGKGRCPNCGTSYAQFKKVGRLGCSQCYDHFQAQLLPLFRSVHGNTRHVGKVPNSLGEQITIRRKVQGLRDELALAVEKERYEEAARLRDEIKALEENGSREGQ